MAPADRRPRRSRRPLGDRESGRRTGVGHHAGDRRASHRGRRPLASLPPSAHPIGDPAAGDGRGTAALRTLPWQASSATSTGRPGTARPRLTCPTNPWQRSSMPPPIGRSGAAPWRRGGGARASGHSERGRSRPRHAAPARGRSRERDRPHGRHCPDARRGGADRRPGTRGSTPGLDHRPVAQRAAVAARECRPPAVVAAAKRAGEDGQADLGLALLQFASARELVVRPRPGDPFANRRSRSPAGGPGPTLASFF